MDTKEIIKRVKRIELKSRRKTGSLFMGEYQSSFKGRGMIFSEIRPYQYGDDVRSIDWNKTAHFNETYVKVFEEERELTMMLLVDISASESFGTKKQPKSETIAEICATLAFSAITYNDKVGLLLFTDKVELFIPPKKGKKHALRIIRELVTYEPQNKGTDLNVPLEFLMNSFKRKTNVFILSDFLNAKDYVSKLKVASKKHEIAGIKVYDEKEKNFPNLGLVNIKDSETGEVRLIDTSSARLRNKYSAHFIKINKEFQQNFRESGAGTLVIRNDEDYIKPLLNYFKQRAVI